MLKNADWRLSDIGIAMPDSLAQSCSDRSHAY